MRESINKTMEIDVSLILSASQATFEANKIKTKLIWEYQGSIIKLVEHNSVELM